MILIPGVEITNNTDLYHIVAVDVKEYVDPSLPVEEIVEKLKEQNALVIAAHPDRKSKMKNIFRGISGRTWSVSRTRSTREIANRDDLFNSVGVKKYRYVANSDFHELWHVYSWKTLVKSEKTSRR